MSVFVWIPVTDALISGYRDEVVRALHERGPCATVHSPRVAGASLTALQNSDSKLRPVAV